MALAKRELRATSVTLGSMGPNRLEMDDIFLLSRAVENATELRERVGCRLTAYEVKFAVVFLGRRLTERMAWRL